MVSRDIVVDRDAKARACEAILKSRTLARSEQLAQFLRYICELELEGRGGEITEYTIAVHALNRPADYAPGEDSSVRSRAHALRRKLQEYYDLEAPDAELRIELPKGTYRPAFVLHTEPVAPPPQLEPAPGPAKRNWLRWVIALCAVTALLAGALLFQIFRADPIDPLVREAWGPVLRRGADVLVVISARPLLRVIPSQPDILPESGSIEVGPGWVQDWYSNLNMDNRGGPVYLRPTRGYAGFPDLFASMTVSSMLTLAGASYHAMPEDAVGPRAIHETGLVVIGAPAYTPLLQRVLKATPYSIWFDKESNQEVLGLRDQPTAQAFRPKKNPAINRYSTVYGLITVLPPQPGHDRPERMLMFAGFTGSPGAQAAIDFFRSPEALQDLQQRFRQHGYRTFPPAYQVVVRCGVDAETAINAVYQTHIVLSSVPVIE